jgi:hypothetical protein
LAAYRDARENVRIAQAAADAGGARDATEAVVMFRAFSAFLADAADRYRAAVPRVAISRCPLSAGIVRHSIDTGGLDGPWWDYESPVRPDETLPPTCFAVRGAVRLSGAVETPFLAMPGPEAPYVLPGLLARDDAIAVVSSLSVGAHRAYAICYFGDPPPGGRLNAWGAGHYALTDARGRTYDGAYEPTVDEMDFDLAPWISAGKLMWIAIRDDALRLRTDVKACPYVGLPGRREVVRVEGRRVWSESDVLSSVGTRARGGTAA